MIIEVGLEGKLKRLETQYKEKYIECLELNARLERVDPLQRVVLTEEIADLKKKIDDLKKENENLKNNILQLKLDIGSQKLFTLIKCWIKKMLHKSQCSYNEVPVRMTTKAERLKKIRESITKALDQIDILFKFNFNSDAVEIEQFRKRLTDMTEENLQGN